MELKASWDRERLLVRSNFFSSQGTMKVEGLWAYFFEGGMRIANIM